jgi:hypothetical protein
MLSGKDNYFVFSVLRPRGIPWAHVLMMRLLCSQARLLRSPKRKLRETALGFHNRIPSVPTSGFKDKDMCSAQHTSNIHPAAPLLRSPKRKLRKTAF